MKVKPELERRDWIILSKVAEGMTNREIAVDLRCSPRRIDEELSSIYVTLHVRNRAAAAAYFARHGRGWMFEGDLVVR